MPSQFSAPTSQQASSASVEGRIDISYGTAVLTFAPLDLGAILASVQHDTCGAVASFIGTTRNNFGGKRVARLEYEAYTLLALKTLVNILHAANIAHAGGEELHVAVHHRLGEVAVGEASIVIAVAAPHRAPALAACAQLIEDVKARAQIWKREWYVDEDVSTARWKANAPGEGAA